MVRLISAGWAAGEMDWQVYILVILLTTQMPSKQDSLLAVTTLNTVLCHADTYKPLSLHSNTVHNPVVNQLQLEHIYSGYLGLTGLAQTSVHVHTQ